MGSGGYSVRPEAVRSAVGNVGSILMRASSTLLALEQPLVDPASFASIGSGVGAAIAELQDQQVAAMRCVLSLLQDISSRVQASADSYQDADVAVAARYLGKPAAVSEERRIWSSAASAALASQATGDSNPGGAPTPHRAAAVIGYLAGAGLGQLAPDGRRGPLPAPAGSAGDLAAWLADRAGHQARVGVIAVYAGAAGSLDDTPGGLRPGDVVCIEPGTDAADQDVTVGVVGTDGSLYNHGLLAVDLGGVGEIQVYRPIGGQMPPGIPLGSARAGQAS